MAHVPLQFAFNLDKCVAALSYLSNVPDFTKFRAAKLLFFADKYHLTKYGRPIIGDRYAQLDHGPVPSLTLDLINELITPLELSGIGQAEVARLEQYLEVDFGDFYPTIRARRDPDLSVLSESDIEALDFTIKNYGNKSVTGLRKASHRERAWKEAVGHWMDYRMFFDPKDSSQTELLEYIEEQQELESALCDITD